MDFYKKPEEKKTTSYTSGSSSFGSGSYWKGGSSSWSTGWGNWWKEKKKEKKKYSSRLGFGSSSYSYSSYGSGYNYYDTYSYKSKDSSTKQLLTLKKAYNNARDLVNILDFPFPLDIFLNNDEENVEKKLSGKKSDARKIYVSTDIIKSVDSKEEKEIIDVISGAALHEASHLMFTSSCQMQKIFGNPKRDSDGVVKPYTTGLLNNKLKYLSIEENKRNMCCNLAYQLFSFIEDERVDTELLEERNGFIDYVESNKNYLYEQVEDRFTNALENSGVKNYIKFYLSLIQLIRFPDKVKEIKFMKDNPEIYSTVSFILDKYKPTSTLGSCIQAVKLLHFLLNVINKIENLDELSEILKEEEKEKEIEDSVEQIDLSDLKVLNSKTGLEKLLYLHNSSAVRDIIKTLDSTVLYGSDLDLSDSCKLSSKKEGISMRDSLISRGIYDVVKDTYFIKVGGDEHDKADYIREVAYIKDMIPSMRNLVRNTNKNFEFIIPSQRTGKLDTTKLVEAYQGVPHVYNKLGRVSTSRAHICVVIDESGSMCCDGRSANARRAAILMNEAFGNIPGIELYIYGHTADDIYTKNTTIHVYREPGFKTLYNGVGLSQSEAFYENRDGQAYRDIANRVRSFTQQPVIMFVLSDGNPSAGGYRGNEAIYDTVNAVKEIEKMGFNMIQVILAEGLSKDLTAAFKSHIIIKSIDKLPSKLAGETRKLLLKILQDNQTTVTY